MLNVVPFNSNTSEKVECTENDMILPPLLSIKELCEYLGLKETTVRGLIRTGEIPHVRIKGSIRILATDVRAYLERNIRVKKNQVKNV